MLGNLQETWRSFLPSGTSSRDTHRGRLEFEPLEARLVLDAGLPVISEFMAVNDSVLADEDGAFSDWVEIHNPAANPVQLDGWYLTDDETDLHKWQFPATTIDSGGHLVVFASDKDRTGDELHGNFKLKSDGEYLGLVRPDGVTVQSQYAPQYPPQVADVSYGWSADFSTQGYFARPTPGGPGTAAPVADPTRQILISEIMYHPAGEDVREEYIELFNQGTEPVRLSGWQLGTAVDFTFPDVTLDAEEYLVVAADVAALRAKHPDVANVVGGWTGELDDAGETIELVDAAGERIDRVGYGSSGSWPGRADGKGSSLQIRQPAADNDDSDNWRSSTEYGGSPGQRGMGDGAGSGPLDDVQINEVLSHTDPPLSDAIELVNTTGGAIDLGGWYLSDSSNDYFKFQIPQHTILGAGQYIVFDESDFNPTPLHPGPNDFALGGAHGDDVWLVAADANGNPTRFVDHVSFGAAPNGETFGRWPDAQGDLYPMRSRTLGSENSGPRVGPVVISEVMYHPPDPGVEPGRAKLDDADSNDLEFIEIYNSSHAAVDLTDWRIRKGIDYDFAAGTTIAPRSALVVVRFDPEDAADAGKLSDFLAHYQIGGSVQLAGGYSGKLDNGGEKIRLQRPDEPPQDEPDFIPRLLEDEVNYDDDAPWPADPDGEGSSLHRLAADRWGHDAAGWTAAEPTPGSTPFPTVEPSAQSLGPINFLELKDLDGSAGDLWYRFETTRAGLITLDASAAGASLTLYDESGNQLTTSKQADQRQRIDWQAGASGETYYFKLAGGGADVDLRLVNLVSRAGGNVTVYGTTGDDRFEFRAAQSRQVTINQVQYDFDDAEATSVTFDGLEGSDTAVLWGTDGDETAVLWPDHAMLSGDGYEVTAANVESTTAEGLDGNDQATLHDSPQDDLLVTWRGGASMSGPAVHGRVNGFETIFALATAGGSDAAKMFDSPGNDVFVANPDAGALYGTGFFNRAEHFEAVYAYAAAGGHDVAKLFDSPGDDEFVANPDAGAIYGDGFFNRAKYFEGVYAYATAGGKDVAKLFDSPGDDEFVASPDAGALYGDGFFNRAKSFEGVHAYATAGGKDVAKLFDSPGNDTFYAIPDAAALFGQGFFNRAKYFEGVHAYATAGGEDVAELFDSPGDDTFAADASAAALFGEGFFNRAKYFEKTHARSIEGGIDEAYLFDATLYAGLATHPLEGPDAEFSRVAWLYEFEVCFNEDRSSGNGPVQQAVDQILSAYWP